MSEEQAVVPMTPAEETKAYISHRVEQSETLLKFAGISPAVFERVALNAILQQPGLVECDRNSLRNAIIRCAEMGLLPDGRQAAIWPVKEQGKQHKTAICVPMIEGRLRLARKATPGLSITVRAVFEGEKFVHEEGLLPVLRHVPVADVDRRDENLKAVYAIARIPGGAAPEFEVMYRPTINRYRQLSKAKKAGAPWQAHYVEMAKKTVLGQLLKRLPKMPGSLDEDEDLGDGIDGYQEMVNAEAVMMQEPAIDVPAEDTTETVEVQEAQPASDEPPLPEPPPPDPGEPLRPDEVREPAAAGAAQPKGKSPF